VLEKDAADLMAFLEENGRAAFASSSATIAGNAISSWLTKLDVVLTFTPIRSMRQA